MPHLCGQLMLKWCCFCSCFSCTVITETNNGPASTTQMFCAWLHVHIFLNLTWKAFWKISVQGCLFAIASPFNSLNFFQNVLNFLCGLQDVVVASCCACCLSNPLWSLIGAASRPTHQCLNIDQDPAVTPFTAFLIFISFVCHACILRHLCNYFDWTRFTFKITKFCFACHCYVASMC